MGRFLHRVLFLLSALAVLAVAGLPGRAVADPVRVRGGVHEGFGRIAFTWPSPVGFEAAVDGTRLTVRFDRDIEADYGPLVRTLRAYVAGAAAGADGRSVEVVLRRPLALRSFDLGSMVVVDLLDDGATAATAESAPAPAPAEDTAASEVPALGVRYGVHEGFDRVVFDWPTAVPYEVTRDGERAVITFDRPGRLVTGRPPALDNLRRLAAEVTDGKLAVTLGIPAAARLRHFRSGPKVVVDIGAPPEAPTPSPAPAPAPITAPAAAAEPAPAPAPETAAAAAPAPEPKPEPAPAPAPAPAPEAASAPPAEAPAATPAPAAPAAAPPAETAAAEKPGMAPPLSLIPEKRDTATAAEASPGATAEGAAPPAAAGTALRFDWDSPVAAAVFRRAGALWVVFDKDRDFDPEALRQGAAAAVRRIDRVPAGDAAVFRVQTIAGLNPEIHRDNLAWVLDFKKQPLAAVVPIESKTQLDSPLGARLFLPVAEPGRAIALTDPEVGDNLVVVPVIPLGHGLRNGYDYPQMRFPATAQGIVVEPRTDGLRVRPIRQGVEVTSTTPLLVTPVSEEERAESRLAPSEPLTRILALERWRGLPLEDFVDNREALQLAVATAEPDKRHDARMDLARFYFANRYGAEALGVLATVARERPESLEEAEFHLLRGGANLMMDRPAEAAPDLDHASLDGSDEGAFWRAVLAARQGRGAAAAAELKRTGAIVLPYPKALRTPLGITIADAAVDAGDVGMAERQVQALLAGDPPPVRRDEITFVDGRLEELKGEFNNAVARWETVQNGAHRPSRARATMARAELLLKEGQMTPAEAIDELESLRFTWRGDDFEFNLLRRLGNLYLEQGDFRRGLRTLRQAATHFRDHPQAAQVTQRMADTFRYLFQEGAADRLPPVSAIALYEEFRELTPPGAAGDEMIRKLADRLVGVDLLDQAAALLENQVEFRLQGEEKARVGARLALVRILGRAPDKAIKALDDSAADQLPPDLTAQRARLRARALTSLDRFEDALALLAEDDGREAEELRTEIFWRQPDWRKAAQSLRSLTARAGVRPGIPLSPEQAGLVMNLAVALTLSDNERGVARLRADLGQAMDASRFRDAFRLVTQPPQRGLLEPAQVAARVRGAENFVSFMARYREDLRNGRLSDVN
ncbi:MAG: tetratricopeptide repeat protein [Hyphomicrobiales bacterium]|nr:tetratricopeptide repeat protein [Hyphomicrobiales bacterium]MCP5373604.1 tetratricopeptide repeat protein [Hyphomicrobiales bacterium]